MKNNVVELAFAADNNYFIPFFVSVLSVFVSCHKETTYNVHLLFSGELTDDNCKLLNYLRSRYNTHRIFLHHIEDDFHDAKLFIRHITSATFYRLKLPTILSNCEKVLYLDVDIIVCKDLTELYGIDLNNNYCAGVRAAAYLRSPTSVNRTINLLKIDKLDRYINAGVILINLKKMREDKLESCFMRLLKNDYPSQDQDIINKACYPKIIILPFKYNVMTKYRPASRKSYFNIGGVANAYSFGEWQEARIAPVIIHYADKKKPWNDLNTDYSILWWSVLSKTPFFTHVYKKYRPKFHFVHGIKQTNIFSFVSVKIKIFYLRVKSFVKY